MIKTTEIIKEGNKWPPVEDNEALAERLTMIKTNREIMSGKLDYYTKQFEALGKNDSLTTEQGKLVFIGINLARKLTEHWRDMLFHILPTVQSVDPETGEAQNKEESKEISRLVEESKLLSHIAPEVQVDRSAFGSGVFKISLKDDAPIIKAIKPESWFPVENYNDSRHPDTHVLAWDFIRVEKDNNDKPIEKPYVRFEIHKAGSIEYRIYEYNQKNQTIGKLQDLAEFEPELAARKEVDSDGIEQTGIDEPLIVEVIGWRTSADYFGQNDFTEVESLIVAIMARISHIDMILDRHAEPNMAGPILSGKDVIKTGDKVKARGKYFGVPEGESPPHWLNFEASLESSFKQLEQLINLFYMMSNTSPAMFSQTNNSAMMAVESGAALKRLMIKDEHRIARDKAVMDEAIKRVVRAIGLLLNKKYWIKIHWGEAIPIDRDIVAQTEIALVNAGLSDKISAIMRIFNLVYEEDAQRILERIEEERSTDSAFQIGEQIGKFGR